MGYHFLYSGFQMNLKLVTHSPPTPKIFASASGTLASIVTVPGPAKYEDKSGTPLVSVTDPSSGELTGNSTDGFTGTFGYSCNDEGLGIYASDLSVQVVFNLNSEEIQAESFANFITTVECVPEALPTVTLTAELKGDGSGTVTSEPAGINCPGDCAEDYTQGDDVILDANADEGSMFVSWDGDIGENSPDDPVITLTMDQNRNVTATFSIIPSYVLEVLKDGSGSGTVTSDPPGIDYGGDNTEDYPENTVVTLTAASDEGSDFIVWSELGVEISNNPVIQITMDQARTLTATFDEEDPSGNIGVFLSGTNSPWEISVVPNPSGNISFPTSCPYVWFVFGQDIGVVDPCSGIVLQTLDIPFEVFSSTAGSNGGFALEPANGMNYLFLKSQSGKSIATITN